MNDSPTDPPAPPLRLALVLTAVVGLGALSIDMFLPSLPAIAREFGTGAGTAQLTVTLFLMALAAAQLVFGPLSDRFGRRRVLLGGLALYAVGGLGCWLAPGIRLLIAARVLQAVGAASGPVVARAIVRDVYAPQRAARILAYMGTAQALTPILAPVVGGLVHDHLGWRAVFLVLAGLGTVFTAAAAAFVRETHLRHDPGALANLPANARTLLRDRVYLRYVLLMALMFGGQFAFISGSSFVLVAVLGMAPARYGLAFGAVACGLMAGSFVSARLTLRLGIDRLIRGGTLLGAAAGSAMAGLVWLGLATPATIVVPMAAFALGLGLTLPNAMAGAIGPFPHMAGLASAVLGFLQLTASALYGIAVGQLYDGTARPMATAIATAGLAACAAARGLSGRGRAPIVGT